MPYINCQTIVARTVFITVQYATAKVRWYTDAKHRKWMCACFQEILSVIIATAAVNESVCEESTHWARVVCKCSSFYFHLDYSWSNSVLFCVSSGGAPTLAGTSMFTVWNLCTHMKCEVRHNWDMGMEHLWINGWGIYSLIGQGRHSKLLFRLEKC